MATTAFNDLITFSRGSNATVVGSNGLIQWAPSNLLTNSQDFEASAWTKGAGATVVANNQAAPDGTTTADTITFTAGGAAEFVRGFTTMVVGLVYTVSVYARRVSGTPNFVFDVGNSAAVSGTQTLTTDWQRFTFTFTFSGANQWVDLEATAAGSIAFWGGQLELGSTATTYNNTSVRNLLGFSEAFDNAAWTKSGTSIVTGAQANPVNGLFNAQKLMEDTANSGHQINQAATTSANPFTFSVYAKAAGRNFVALGITDSGSTVRISYFDLANGVTATVATGITASIVSIGNGWYRCAVTVAAAFAGSNLLRIYATNVGNNATYTGDGNSGVYIYGAMLSNSASLDPYVPTPGAAPSSTAYYGPRFDYDPVTLAARGLLVEEARTNFLRYSNEFDNVVWTNASPSIPTVTTNTATAPDGTITADTLTAATGGTSSQTRQIASSTGATGNFTGSVFLKAGTSTRSRIIVVDSTSSFNVIGDFAIAWSGGVASVQSVTLGTASVTAVGNGWYRCALTASAPSANASVALAIFPDILVGTNSVVAWGAQLEAGAFATSYIPTIASTVTRSADVVTITGSLFSQWYTGAAGSFIIEGTSSGQQFSGFFNLTGGTEQQAYDNGTSVVACKYGAVNISVTIIGGKFATAYNSGGTIAVSGVNSASNATAFTGNATGMEIGLSTFPRRLNGYIRSIRYVPVRAADFQLQQVTT